MLRLSAVKYLMRICVVAVRLPPLFVMDYILQSRFCVNVDPVSFVIYLFNILVRRSAQDWAWTVAAVNELSLSSLFTGVLYMLGFFMAVYTFLLSSKQLILLYRCSASIVSIFCSYILNLKYVEYCCALIATGTKLPHELFLLKHPTLELFLGNYIIQSLLALIFCFCNTNLPHFPPKKVVAGISFILPTLISALPVPEYTLHNSPTLTATVEISFLIHYLMIHFEELYDAILLPIRHFFILFENYEAIYICQYYWKKTQLFCTFKMFWYVRTLKHTLYLIYLISLDQKKNVFYAATEHFNIIAPQVVAQCCNTFVAVIGLSCVLTSSIATIVSNIQDMLVIAVNSRQQISCAVSLIFILHAVQSGLTGLAPQDRITILYRNVVLILPLVTIIIYDDIHNALCHFSTTGRTATRHRRAVVGGIVFLLYSFSFMLFVFRMHSYSSWFLAAATFSVEAIIIIVVSFLNYALNIIDARYSTTWENFDHYLFWNIATSKIIYYLFNLMLFFNSLYILLYESFGVTRIALIWIHGYFNLWIQIQVGFKNIKNVVL